jgi:hypothetical protein
VPAVPDVFIADNYQLNQLAWGNLMASGTDLYHELNDLPAPDGTTQVVGTLQRVRAGTPLPAAVFAPYIGVTPSPHICTIRRRLRSVRGIAPT